MELGPAGLLFAAIAVCSTVFAAGPLPLLLEEKIELGSVSGRIDHLAVDLGRQRMFVAELGNDTVGVVDLSARKLLRRLTGFREPQGLGFVASTDTLYVSNAGDGSVRLFQGADLSPAGRIDLGDDADNIRVDERTNNLYVGYGKGAIAIVDTATRSKVGDIQLSAHPEGFQLDGGGSKIFVNVPTARHVAVIDIALRKVVKAFETKDARANFSMAVDHDTQRVLSVFRNPAKLIAYASVDGSVLASFDICGDADDVFTDAKRRRVYVSCGDGFIDILETTEAGYSKIGRVTTTPGARTSLFVPALDRLYVAVGANGTARAAIWVFRPQ